MKKSYLLVAGLALMSAFTACSNDDEPQAMVSGPQQTLEIQGVGLAQLGTKAGIMAGSFKAGNPGIGVYVVRTNLGSAYEPGTSTDYKNVKFTGSGDTPWGTDNPVYLTSTPGTIFAYYPYSEGNNGNNGKTIPVSVADNQGTGQSDGTEDAASQSDYMYGTGEATVNNTTAGTNVQMNHALAMISFKFKRPSDDDAYTGIGKVTEIVLKNKDTKTVITTGDGTMDIQTGVVTALAGETTNTITVSPNTSTLLYANPATETPAADVPRILVYPKQGAIEAGDVLAKITVDGKAYTVNLPALAGGIVAGSNYEFTYTMRGTEMTIDKVSITPWTNVENAAAGDIK